MKQAGPFEIVTSVVVARSVLEPLGPSLPAQMDLEEAFGTVCSAAEEGGYVFVDRVSLVYDGPELVGWYTADMGDPDSESVAEVKRRIYALELVSADTSVFKLVQLLADRPRSGAVLFVLDQDAIIGTISHEMLRHPVFRLCLFALSLELEEASLSAAMVNPLASWNTLSPARRAKAQEVHDRISSESHRKASSLAQKPWGQLLASTTIADKGKIVAKLKLLPGRSRSQVESLFAKVEQFRNWCAHTSDSRDESRLNLEPKHVARFITSCTEAISTLRSIAGSKEGTG